MADYLVHACNLQPEANQTYESDIPIYNSVCRLAELQQINNLPDYIDFLSMFDDLIVFIAVLDNMQDETKLEQLSKLNLLGIKTDISQIPSRSSYIAVIDDFNVVYEALSNKRIDYTGALPGDIPYHLLSSGWYTNGEASIQINEMEYSLSGRGINMVIYDKESGCVLDSVAFDPLLTTEGISATRDYFKDEVFLRTYEQYLMEQDYAKGLR